MALNASSLSPPDADEHEHPVKVWSMVMFMVQSNLRRYIRDSKDIGKAQLNKKKYHEVMLPNELSRF